MTAQPWRDRAILFGPFLFGLMLTVGSPVSEGPTLCPFALVTGVACPGCGMTRAVSHLLHGDLGIALRYHPLVPMVVLGAVAAWARFMLRRGGRLAPMKGRTVNVILIASAISLLAVWVLRLATGSLPPV